MVLRDACSSVLNRFGTLLVRSRSQCGEQIDESSIYLLTRSAVQSSPKPPNHRIFSTKNFPRAYIRICSNPPANFVTNSARVLSAPCE